MERMLKMTLKEFAQAVASDSFAPGGGCVSALAGSMAASLATMVLTLTIGKKKYLEFDETNKKTLTEVEKHAQKLLDCVERDAQGCDWILEALALPKNNDLEKNKRKTALSEAGKKANEAPLDVCDSSLTLLRIFKNEINHVNRNAITDWAVGAMHAYTALEGAAMNAKINCGSIEDTRYCRELEEKFPRMLGEARTLIDEIRNHVHSSLDSTN